MHQVGCPGGVRGEKTEGKEEVTAEMGRELYISDAYGRAFSASHQREAPDSFPFATCASLACTLSFLDLEISIPCLQSHTPPHSRFSVFPSVADKTSFPFQNFSSESPPSDPLQIQILCPPARVHPIPIFSFTAQPVICQSPTPHG